MLRRPTAGQVALANSGGQWAFVLSGLALAAADADSLDEREIAAILLASMDAGLLAGSYLAWRNPNTSRAQTLVIDAGGIVGAVGGGSLGIVIGGSFDDRSTPLAAAIGTVIGLGTAAYFTRNWNDQGGSSTLQTYIAPVERGRGGVAGVGYHW
jgi:hypothetical protein